MDSSDRPADPERADNDRPDHDPLEHNRPTHEPVPVATPPIDATTAPPANAGTAPPANAVTAPPVDAVTAPPVDAVTARPADAGTAPPADADTAPPGAVTAPPADADTAPSGAVTAPPTTAGTAPSLYAGAAPAVAVPEDPELNFDQPVAVVPVVPYEGVPGFDYTPPVPEPVGPPKSVAGAALLNLTGLGLGYVYLRNRGLVVMALFGTAVLITVGFVADASTKPWLWRGAALCWLVALAAHAAFLAGRRGSGAAQGKPELAGVAAVAVVVAGYVGYGLAGASAYDRGVAAQANGDCATAADEFASVSGVYRLTLSGDIAEARKRAGECAVYQRALTAQKRGDYPTAITLYEQLGDANPDSVLAPYVHTNLADSYFARATSWKSPVTEVDAKLAVDTLLRLTREFDDTEAAKKVPKAITDLFTEATKPYGDGKFCDVLGVLGYFAALDPASVGEQVSAAANVFRARSLYECGLGQVRANQYPDAITTLETFLAAYPNDGGVAQAKSALIAARVADATQAQLPVPPPLGGNDPGRIPVTFYNDSSTPVTIFVAGPTAHEITVPGCPTCTEVYPKDDPAACRDLSGRPSVTLRLLPGTYHYTTDDRESIRQATDSITTQAGWEYQNCMFKEWQA